MLHAFGVHLHVLHHFGIHTRQKLEEVLKRTELLHLAHGRKEVFKVHAFLAHLLFKLFGFGFVESFLRFFNQRHHVAHLQDAASHALRVKLFERVGLLTNADVLDGLAENAVNGKRRATACVAIQLGKHYARNIESFVKALSDLHRLLTCHAVGNEQNFIRLDGCFELLELIHHGGINLKPAGRVDNHDAVAVSHTLINACSGDLHHVTGVAIGVDGHIQRAAKSFELINGRGSVHVCRHQTHALFLVLESAGQLACGGCLAGALKAHHHHHSGRHGTHPEPLTPLTQHGGKLIVDYLHELLSGLHLLELQHTNGLFLHPFQELPGEGEVHVCFEENAPYLTHSLLDVGFVEYAAAAQLGKDIAEFICKLVKHGCKLPGQPPPVYSRPCTPGVIRRFCHCVPTRSGRLEDLSASVSALASASTRDISIVPRSTPRSTSNPMPRGQRKEEILRAELPPALPLMALRSTIVYPLGTIAVQMGAPENLALLRAHEESGLVVALVVASEDLDEIIDPQQFTGRVGVAARVHERINLPGDTVQITLQGLRRIVIGDIDQVQPFPVAQVEGARETPADQAELEELVGRTIAAAETLAELVDRIPNEVPQILKMNVSDPGRFADLAATNMNLRIADKEEVLQSLDIGQRIRFILSRLEREVARARVMEDVKKQTEIKIEQHQREFYLRQQLRAIQAELGDTDPNERESNDLLKRIDEAGLPEKVAVEARRENERLRMLSPASSEYQVLRTYLEWVLALPWSRHSANDGSIALEKVEDALDGKHYGLDEAKERIVEYLAVRKLRGGDPSGSILCFVGPPGTGKTSLGEAIAESIGRAFYRISVGGVRDEAEIRGHRRTYVGSMPGLLLQALRRVEVRDPVVMIDEIDKMSGGGPGGDPTAAMLEVLDPAQNTAFVDHYLNLPFDLSGILFICTANNLFDIPGPLRDRMEVIRIAGYTIEEKVEIAQRYLLPRLLGEHGLSESDLHLPESVLSFITSRYSREAGLRTFERSLSSIMRKRARAKANGDESTWEMSVARTEQLLGVPRFPVEEAEQEPEIGAVTGLAWTSTGGDLMTIEALRMPGTGKLTVTGQLGEVMRESVDAAFSFVRSRAETLGISDSGFRDTDVHLHFPAGAIPKDGPSAGIAVTLALSSALSGRPVRRDVALTGEVTLRGKVLEVGGVKEKVLAAYRSGLREVILPRENEKDVRDVPEEVRQRMAFTFTSSMDEVFHLALLPHANARPADIRGPARGATPNTTVDTHPADRPKRSKRSEPATNRIKHDPDKTANYRAVDADEL